MAGFIEDTKQAATGGVNAWLKSKASKVFRMTGKNSKGGKKATRDEIRNAAFGKSGK